MKGWSGRKDTKSTGQAPAATRRDLNNVLCMVTRGVQTELYISVKIQDQTPARKAAEVK